MAFLLRVRSMTPDALAAPVATPHAVCTARHGIARPATKALRYYGINPHSLGIELQRYVARI
jgi:hypothetical protein